MVNQMHATPLSREELALVRRQVLVQDPITRRWVKGKGFSYGELKEAGIDIKLAKKLRLPVDKRRKSVHERNIEFLRQLFIKKFGEKISEARAPKEKPEEEKIAPTEEKIKVKTKPITLEESLERVVDSVIGFLDGANRRKREKILSTFIEVVKENMPEVSKKSEDELAEILEKLLDDLAMAGLGKLSKAFFTKSKDWDVTMAREIMMESLKRHIKG